MSGFQLYLEIGEHLENEFHFFQLGKSPGIWWAQDLRLMLHPIHCCDTSKWVEKGRNSYTAILQIHPGKLR